VVLILLLKFILIPFYTEVKLQHPIIMLLEELIACLLVFYSYFNENREIYVDETAITLIYQVIQRVYQDNCEVRFFPIVIRNKKTR
jgi:hypothetical protein